MLFFFSCSLNKDDNKPFSQVSNQITNYHLNISFQMLLYWKRNYLTTTRSLNAICCFFIHAQVFNHSSWSDFRNKLVSETVKLNQKINPKINKFNLISSSVFLWSFLIVNISERYYLLCKLELWFPKEIGPENSLICSSICADININQSGHHSIFFFV